jgi:Tfp pilus assembly PilM family ATPase
MKQYRIVLGIEVGRDFLRLAEVEHRDGVFFLSRVATKKLEAIEVDELVRTISRFMNEESIMSRVASIAIDTSLLARDTIEIDSDIAADEISKFLRGEIDFHNNFSGKSFIPAYEITKAPVDPYKEVFYAAMDKQLLVTLRDACTRCGLDLQFVDLDHSCSELAVNLLEQGLASYILISVKPGQVEASFCKNGERVFYRYATYTDEPFYLITKLSQNLEMLARADADKIFVTGVTTDDFLMGLLQKNVDKRYTLLDPLRSMQLSAVASESKELDATPHHYSHVIGAALK